MKKIGPEFFNRESVLVAQDLPGKYLVRQNGEERTALMINEVEVYDGFDDEGSHAIRGLTRRTEIMFGPAGYFYIYLIYGMYWMINIVTREEGYPAAILIRGAGEMDGPGKLSKFLKVDGKLNGMKADPKTGLWFEEGKLIHQDRVKTYPRIGINYAAKEWRDKELRFLLVE